MSLIPCTCPSPVPMLYGLAIGHAKLILENLTNSTCGSLNWITSKQPRNFYRPHPKDDRRLYFHIVCQSTPGGGGTYLPGGGGGGGVPTQVWVGGTYLPRSGWGVTTLARVGVVPTFPCLGGGVPTLVRGGSYLSRSGWGGTYLGRYPPPG